MKKTLLIGLMAMAGVVAQAQEYAYTTFAKVKIVGEELVVNGDFSATDSYEGWAGADGFDVDPQAWAFVEAVGPNGENVMQAGGTTQEGALTQAVAVEPGTYYVSFQLLGTASNSSKAVFFNTDGAVVPTDADRVVINCNNLAAAEWTLVADTVSVNEDGFIVFNLAKLAAEAQVTCFSVKPANVVYDTRAMERFAEYANAVVNSGYFTSDNADFEGWLSDLNAYLNGELPGEEFIGENFDDEGVGQAELQGLQDALNEYLAENSADLLADEKAWNTYGKTQKVSGFGNWKGNDGRWFHGDIGSDVNANEVSRGYFYGYADNMTNGYLYYPITIQTSGTYMFKADVKAWHYLGKNIYTPNHNIPYKMAYVFGGKTAPTDVSVESLADNTIITCENMETSNYHSYVLFVDAEAGETLNFGSMFVFDGNNPTNSNGGVFLIANPVLRLVGVTQADLDYQKLVNDIKTQQSVLGERIITANEMVARTKADGFPWGHAALQLAIDTITPIYTESFNVIDAEGNVVDEDRITEEYRDEVLLNAVNSIKRSWQAFESLNAHYTNLLVAIAAAQASNDDPLNAAGDHATFQAVIDAAQDIADGITGDETLEGFTPADCDAAILELQAAQAAFEASTASFSNPSELTIQNADFSNGDNANTVVGWTFTANDTGKEQYKRSADANFEGGYRRGVWRGNTVAPTSKLVQTLNLVPAGVYEYRAQAYAANEGDKGSGGGQDQAMWKIIYETVGDGDEAYEQVVDTIFNGNSEVKLFFGLNGAPDSARVKSPYFGHSIAENRGNAYTKDNIYLPQWYSVYYVKTSAEEETTEFGMDSFGQSSMGQLDSKHANGANAYGFGSNHVFYVGSFAKYLDDIKTDLKGNVDQARQDMAGYGEDHYRTIGDLRLAKAIRYAEEALATEDLTTIANTRWALLQAMQDRAEALIATSITEVNKDEQQTVVREGIYNLQGIRVANDRQALKPGLYIINGKKYFVK